MPYCERFDLTAFLIDFPECTQSLFILGVMTVDPSSGSTREHICHLGEEGLYEKVACLTFTHWDVIGLTVGPLSHGIGAQRSAETELRERTGLEPGPPCSQEPKNQTVHHSHHALHRM